MSPKFPETSSVTGRALARLLKGKRVTHLGFLNEASSHRLAAYILPLRKGGWSIETQMLRKLAEDGSRIVRYGRYSIEPEDLAEYKKLFGARLEGFIESVERFEAKLAGGKR